MAEASTTIAAIYRYPVKGLSAEALDAADLEPGGVIPFDRAYAIENGPSGFDPAAPVHMPKVRFLMLMRNARLAALTTRFDPARRTLAIWKDGERLVEADLETAEGRAAIERFFESYEADELRGPARLLAAPGHSFSDSAGHYLSLINLATLRDLEERLGRPVHPLRFRGNLYVEGLPAWAEFDWLGRTVEIPGGPVFSVSRRIRRCAATEVNPDTAERDIAMPAELQARYGHGDCGIYLEIVEGGRIERGATLSVGSA